MIKKWIDLRDISKWKGFPLDTMYSDLRGIQASFLDENISLNERVCLLARSESFNPTLLVQQEQSEKIFVEVVGSNPYAIDIFQENDEHLILEGELIIEDINWIPFMKIVSFYKHYIVHHEYQKVVVGYESKAEHWIKEEAIRTEKYMIEAHRRFNDTDFQNISPHIVPDDWYTEGKQTTTNGVTCDASISAPGEPHMACVLLLDTSSSMDGAAIAELNKAICDFKEQVCMDELAKKRVDVAIVEFNDTVRVVQDFVCPSLLEPAAFSATGCSSMGNGINFAIDMVKERNRFYNAMGIPCYKPQIIMISKGAPTDDISLAKQRIAEEENKGPHGKLKFWALGVSGYDSGVLKSLTRRYYALSEGSFIGFFDWLADDMVGIGPVCYEHLEDILPFPFDSPIPSDW